MGKKKAKASAATSKDDDDDALLDAAIAQNAKEGLPLIKMMNLMAISKSEQVTKLLLAQGRMQPAPWKK